MSMNCKRAQRFITACVGAGMAFASSSAQAQDFYQGKTLTVIIGNTAGSGYDTYGRLITRFMTKYLPGKPGMIAQNMPGAGSVKAADYLYSIAPKDGTALGLLIPGALVEPLSSDPSKFRYDPTKFEYIGTADSGTRLCFSSEKSPVKTMADARARESVVGATQPAAYARMLNALAKTRFKIVTGYPGPAEMFMALERGETEVMCGVDYNAINTLRPGLLDSSKVNILVQIGLEPKPSLTARGVPSIWQFIEPADRSLVELIVTEQVFQRVFLAPPNTPAGQIKALRTAFDAALKDAELLAEAAKSNLEINPKSGEDVAAHVRKMYAAPKELIDRIAKVTRQ